MSDCYCVCHTPIASKSYCEHCKGDNAVGRRPFCLALVDWNGNGPYCTSGLPCPIHEYTMDDWNIAQAEGKTPFPLLEEKK